MHIKRASASPEARGRTEEREKNMSNTSTTANQAWAVVAAPVVAGSVEEQIAAMRELLASNDPNREALMTGSGTIINPGEGSSVDTNEPLAVVSAPVVAATQWYETNPGLQQAEIKAMHAFHPSAKMGYLPDGRMFWTISLSPKILDEHHDWTFLAVYDADHPQQRWGGSVKFYPVSPNYQEMQARLEASDVTPKIIPHVLRDDERQAYVCSQHMDMIDAGHKKGDKVTSASGCLRNVIWWVNMFEWGLIDQDIWSEFQRHRSAH